MISSSSVFSSSSWLPFWVGLELFSIIVIFAGCMGELLGKRYHFPEWFTQRCGWAVVVGLGIEMLAFGVSYRISNIEIEGLRKANDELEAKLQAPRITAEQMKNFKLLTEHIEKIPIKILTVGASEALNFAHDLREMFTYAGFKTNSDAGSAGINWIDGNIVAKFGRSFGDTNVIFVDEVADSSYVEHNRWQERSTNGFAQPIISVTNERVVYAALGRCFRENGIRCLREGFPELVGTNERAILVIERQH